MKIYVAGPMTGLPRFNFPAFDAAAADLRAQGHEVVSPAELDDPATRSLALASVNGDVNLMRHSWGDFLSRDIKIVVDECEAIAFLPGWEMSRGARLEALAAHLAPRPHEFYEYDATIYSCLRPLNTSEVLDIVRGHNYELPPTESVLAEAERIINADRGDAYGHPYDDFTRSARMMSAVLGVEVRADQVPLLMMAVKLSRLVETPTHRDSAVDIAGYAGCWEKVIQRQQELDGE